ncbi:zinc finger HIT domain-containing protein 1-like [Stegodyphus dumicola]|uniref:zinc finger HIT domain-containing protein 1-like n=1 Tax=Stegodyphus dumicola TaxID=202533 RepID=UPI0015AF377B|nr:zinc finger HIT domain-containing protein 1-like [Stegodyphus dumicola]
MADKRESSRVKEQRKILDEAARRRRLRKQLENLELDNFHDDPHANLVMHKKAPKFEETLENKKRKKLKTEPYKQRFRKNFTALLEEESFNFTKDKTNYLSARVPPSRYPERHFCSVCGFDSNYTCVQCGSRYCCAKCFATHQETRCLKWTA